MDEVITLKALNQEIEEMKDKLYRIADEKLLSSEEVLKVSQMLDSLINQYYRDAYMPAGLEHYY